MYDDDDDDPCHSADYSPEEEWALNQLIAASKDLAEEMEATSGEIFTALAWMMDRFRGHRFDVLGTESAPKAKEDLRELAARADELAACIKRLGDGAFEVMTRPTLRPDLIEDADPMGMRIGPDGASLFFGRQFSDSRWEKRLHALAELARAKADRIEEKVANRGRKSFGARLYGTPEDDLANDCRRFAEAHGCTKQATALRMVQAVLKAEAGKGGEKLGMDGVPVKNPGRKAVRKTAGKNGPN